MLTFLLPLIAINSHNLLAEFFQAHLQLPERGVQSTLDGAQSSSNASEICWKVSSSNSFITPPAANRTAGRRPLV